MNYATSIDMVKTIPISNIQFVPKICVLQIFFFKINNMTLFVINLKTKMYTLLGKKYVSFLYS